MRMKNVYLQSLLVKNDGYLLQYVPIKQLK